VKFTATATGRSSRFAAQTTFTDAAALVQSTSSAVNPAAATISATYTFAPTGGNLLVAIAGAEKTLGAGAPAWSTAVNETGNQVTRRRPSSSRTRPDLTDQTVTVTTDGTTARLGLQIFEYSGLPQACGQRCGRNGVQL
jgi:hypothetical protein